MRPTAVNKSKIVGAARYLNVREAPMIPKMARSKPYPPASRKLAASEAIFSDSVNLPIPAPRIEVKNEKREAPKTMNEKIKPKTKLAILTYLTSS